MPRLHTILFKSKSDYSAVPAVCHCNKIPEIINLKEASVYFGSWFQNFQSMVIWLCCSGSVVAQCIIARTCSEEGVHLMTTRKQKERDKDKRGENQGPLTLTS
jgi:hypothetical protein